MPLKKSGTDEARSANIAEMVKAGHPMKQAVAAAYAVQRKAKGAGAHNGGKSGRVVPE